MFGREPSLLSNLPNLASEAHIYAEHLQHKLHQMYELVELHLINSAYNEKAFYDTRAKPRKCFEKGDQVWLSIPTAGKLDSRWEGGWMVDQYQANQPTVIIGHSDGRKNTVHLNRVRTHVVKLARNVEENIQSRPDVYWHAPSFNHEMDEIEEEYRPIEEPPTRPVRNRRAPTRYADYVRS